MKNQLKDTKLTLMILSTFIHQYTTFSTMKEFYQYCSEQLNLTYNYVQKAFLTFIKNESEMNSELGDAIRAGKKVMEDKRTQKISEFHRERHQKENQATLNKYGDDSILMMRQFVNAEESTINKFCTTFKIDRKEFDFLRKICQKVDSETTELVDQKATLAMQKFLAFMHKTIDEVAQEMLTCKEENKPYDLLKHYETYGYGPNFICRMASKLSKPKQANIIDHYISNNPEVFRVLRPNELNVMMRNSAGFYPGSLFLNGQVVKFKNTELKEAIQTLEEKKIPVSKGTLFGSLNALKKEVKEPVYQKRIRPKI